MNQKGQFSVIAALLVAIILVGTVVMTYSTIRNSPVSEQPQIQSAIDETNLAAKQILGFTVGYYGSVLKSTGNSTYARELATEYLHSGLVYTANMHPEWGTSFDVTNSQLRTSWYSNTSSSTGNLTVQYNLTGLGISGITYETSCSLSAQVLATVDNKARVSASKDGTEPLINLGKSNFKFYKYGTSESKWDLVNPSNEPLAYANGTYELDIPSGVDANSYMIQIEDQRGILVVASSFSLYTCSMTWNVTTPLVNNYVDIDTSDVDSSPNKGTHGNFTAMKYGPDSIMDTLSESITTVATPESWKKPITHEGSGWTNPTYAYDNDTGTRASASIPSDTWSSYLTLVSSAVSCHKIRYFIGRSSTWINQVRIDVYNGSWITIYSGAGTWDAWTNVSFTEMSVSKMRLRFYNDASSSRTAYVYETQLLQSETSPNYELDLEAQWTDVDYNITDQWLCIYGGNMGTEDIRVEIRNGSTWNNLLTDLSTGWNNVSVLQYVASSNLTIRFRGGTETGDATQTTWQIDTALLRPGSMTGESSDETIFIELLQNGTMRWLGENLQLTTQAKPVPPIPVKALHVNQTISGTDCEVPFQIEDWASDYQIPLGLTGNASVFGSGTMLVFLATSKVSRITIWWNGSDTVSQTPFAYTNTYFTGDNVTAGTLTNGIIDMKIENIYEESYGATVFRVTSTQGTSTATARFMRINGENSTYGAGAAYAIHHGIIRDVVHQEAEWNDGADNSPNLYAHIVLTLPANATYYTYQLRLMFVESQQNRTITDLCLLKLTTQTGQPQTENGTIADLPATSNSTGLFFNQPPAYAHHWSQFINGTRGAGIFFTDDANEKLYAFDTIVGNMTGALKVTNSTERTIELMPVAIIPASFQYSLDLTWHGAIATFDGSTPVYSDNAGIITGLWMVAEDLPTIAVETGN